MRSKYMRLWAFSSVVFWMAAAIDTTALAGMSGVTIISERYSISGSYVCSMQEEWGGPVVEYRGSYEHVSEVPVSDGVFFHLLPGEVWAQSSADMLLAYADAGGWLDGSSSVAYAQSTVRFQPLYGTLSIGIEYLYTTPPPPFDPVPLRMTLTDVTSGSVVYDMWDNLEWLSLFNHDYWGPFSLAVDPEHVYVIDLWADTHTSMDENRTLLRVDLVCIPGPGAVVLGAFGAGLVGWLRRRKTL